MTVGIAATRHHQLGLQLGQRLQLLLIRIDVEPQLLAQSIDLSSPAPHPDDWGCRRKTG